MPSAATPPRSASPSRDLLHRIRSRDFHSADGKRALYDELATAKGLRVSEVLTFLFADDAQLRVAAGRCLAANGDADCVRSFLEVAEGRTATARRSALASLLSIPVLNVPRRLEALVVGEDPVLRAQAIAAVLDLPLTRLTAPLVAYVAESGNADERCRAAQRLAASPSDRHRSLYRRLADDPEQTVRRIGYVALVTIADIADLEFIMGRLGQETAEIQEATVRGLESTATRPEVLGVERVLTLLASASPAIRQAGARLLLRATDRQQALRHFAHFSRRLAGWMRERALANLVEHSHEMVDAGLSLTRDSDPRLRVFGFSLVAHVDDPRVVAAASTLLGDSDLWVAVAVAERLNREAAPRYAGVLTAAMARDDLRWVAAHGLGRIGGPAALQALAELTQDSRSEIRVEAMATLAESRDERVVALLEQCVRAEGSKFVRARAADLYRAAARNHGVKVDEEDLKTAIQGSAFEPTSPLHRLLAQARRHGASDLHVAVERAPAMRVGGQLVSMSEEAMSAARTDDLLTGLLSNEQRARLGVERQLDACFFVPNDGRYRGNLFLDRRGLNAVFRVIPETPPNASDLGVPPAMLELATAGGLVIFAGPAGSGKTTTLAAVVNHLNETRRVHILTLEEPVEIVHPARSALVNQRDLGRYGIPLSEAVNAALQQDVDVLVVGETRDVDTLGQLLRASEAGLLVLTTMPGAGAIATLDRARAWLSPRARTEERRQLAANLGLVAAQQLVQAKPRGRVACFEWLRGGSALASSISSGREADVVGLGDSVHTFEESLTALIAADRITAETALRRARG